MISQSYTFPYLDQTTPCTTTAPGVVLSFSGIYSVYFAVDTSIACRNPTLSCVAMWTDASNIIQTTTWYIRSVRLEITNGDVLPDCPTYYDSTSLVTSGPVYVGGTYTFVNPTDSLAIPLTPTTNEIV